MSLPVHKAAMKSVRQDKKANLRNRTYKTRMKTAKNKLERAISEKKNDLYESLFREYVARVDRAVSKGVIHRNTGSRKKMRMAQKLNRMKVS
jgi:small subunit ribosomal protein S20